MKIYSDDHNTLQNFILIDKFKYSLYWEWFNDWASISDSSKNIIMMTKQVVFLLHSFKTFNIYNLWNAIYNNKDFDLFYYQRRYKIEGIEQKILGILDNKFRN